MSQSVRAAAPAVLAAAALAWAYAPTAVTLAARWSADPRYSHGYLVPLFAVGWLWSRRDARPLAATATATPRVAWLGAAVVAIAAGLMFAGTYFFIPWVEAAAIVPALAGLSLIGGGSAGLRWAAPALAFLLFMIPLPYRLEGALGAPLQSAATACSTFLLQTLGLPAFAEGNVITLNAARIGVVEACNGLGMLFTFTALATGLTLAARRSWPESCVIMASAAPIALAANVARITVTGVLYETAGGGVAETVYHDLAGWLMMPLALALLAGVLRGLSRVVLDTPVAGTERSPGRC